MIKILTVVGARPQIIKAAALSRAVKNTFADKLEEKILHTGQHYDFNMSDVFFDEMQIPKPQYNLNVGSESHGKQTARMISGIEEVLSGEKFEAIVLYGDTNSTLAGAIAASKLNTPIIHIEAGLRSFNMAMPEEINRIVCDQLSSLLFAPTQTAIDNLSREGFSDSKAKFANGKQSQIFNSGDIMYDNSLFYSTIAEQKTNILKQLDIKDQDFALATIHRNHNTDNPERLSSVFEAFLEIAESKRINIVLPIHPRTGKALQKLPVIGDKIHKNSRIKLIPPISFFEMIVLEKHAKIIMTDSGGLQKEAYFFKKPCIIIRPETEWVEITEQNAGILTDTNKDLIIQAFEQLTLSEITYPPVFGVGNSAEFILDKTFNYLLYK